MNRLLLICAAGCWLFCTAVWGQEAAETPDPPAAAVDPDLIRIHLMDGSTISGKLSVEEIEVSTAFGNLQVPIRSIRSFTPGLTSHPELARNVESLIEDLGSSNYPKRELAQKALLKLGPPVRGELERRADDTDNERRTRIKELLELFDELADSEDDEEEPRADSGLLIRHDTVETSDFTIVGQIVTQEFTIASQYGPLSIKLSDIRRGEREAPGGGEIRKSLRMDGTHVVQTSMLGSGIKLERGDRVTISAEGQITMSPWGNQASSNPDGAQNFGWYQANTIPIGALVAQIGRRGTIFKVGSKHSFTADKTGTLSFAMAMLPDYVNNQFPGEYRIKVHVQRKKQ
ncbi:MAG: hypothetical protein AB7O62_05730 [Pirellulales bacterium]